VQEDALSLAEQYSFSVYFKASNVFLQSSKAINEKSFLDKFRKLEFLFILFLKSTMKTSMFLWNGKVLKDALNEKWCETKALAARGSVFPWKTLFPCGLGKG